MKEVDVISKYIEALVSGQSEEQAKLFAKSWAECKEIHPESATKHELELSIERVNSSVSKLSLITISIFLVLVVDIIKHWFMK